jgi:SAM-dependent methyltransferase
MALLHLPSSAYRDCIISPSFIKAEGSTVTMDAKSEAVPCVYCGELALAFTRDEDFLECPACGFLRPRWEVCAKEAQASLDAHYGSFAPSKPILNCTGSELRGGGSPQMTGLLKTHCPGVLASGRALDIGAGTGDWVSCLSHLGMRASGIEAFSRSAAIAREFGIDVRHGRFDASTMAREFGSEKFDLISSVGSFCYLDPKQAISLVRERLAPGGFVYIKSPVAESPHYWRGAKIADRIGKWTVCFYTSKTLIDFLKRENFKIIAVRYTPMFAPQVVSAWGISRWIAWPLQVLFRHVFPPDRVAILASAKTEI